MARPAAFLDRDGTLNVRPPATQRYVTAIEQLHLLPGAIEGAARLARAGFALVVVSNQRGVARGLVAESVLSEVEARIQHALAPHGCRIEAFSYCRHDITDHCSCRKPQPGLLLAAAADRDLDLSASWMIGDTSSDVEAGRAAGCRTVLIADHADGVSPDLLVPDLETASRRVVAYADQGVGQRR